MKQVSLLFTFILLMALSAYAQSDSKRTLNYYQLLYEMASCTDSVYTLSNARVVLNIETDTLFVDTIINASVVIDNVEWAAWPTADAAILGFKPNDAGMLGNMYFTKNFSLTNCTGFVPGFVFSTFKGNVLIDNISTSANAYTLSRNTFEGSVRIDNITASTGAISLVDNTFKNTVHHSRIHGTNFNIWRNTFRNEVHISDIISDVLSIHSCRFYGPVVLEEIECLGRVGIYNSHFELSKPPLGKQSYPLKISEVETNYFRFSKDTIRVSGPDQYVLFNDFSIEEYVSIDQCEVQPVFVFDGVTANNARVVIDSDMLFENGIILFRFQYNSFSDLGWPSLKGKIMSFNQKDFYHGSHTLIPYRGETDAELEDQFTFNRMITTRKNILNLYTDQGLREYANEVQVEIRDIETGMWKHRYEKEKTLENYFRWKMNVFLKNFSAYGTDPIISIMYSLKVILLFALFYLFFHNDWDSNSNKRMGKRFALVLHYFKVRKGLVEIENESSAARKEELESLREENARSVGKVPRFFTWVVNRYVRSNTLSEKMRNWLVRKMDILKGTYAELDPNTKFKVAFISSVWLVVYSFYFFTVKVLNAFTLSLNAFTTLGFGDIPTKGFSRYIVIIQGFIGWVLMTIFSATLITQLLQ